MKVSHENNKKHPQSILGFFSQYFEGRFGDGLTEYPHQQFLDEVQPYHVIAERNMLENYLGVRQALPCAAIRNQRENGDIQYWLFQRTNKIGEERLGGKVACFWGGHVDGKDAYFKDDSVLDMGASLVAGRDREQGEEYRIYCQDDPDTTLYFHLTPSDQFIANSTVEVDKYHVAIIYTIDLPVNYAVKVLEEELIGMAPMTAQEALYAHEAGTFELESWALIYFRHIVAQNLLDSGAKVAIEPMVDSGVPVLEGFPILSDVTETSLALSWQQAKGSVPIQNYELRISEYTGAKTNDRPWIDLGSNPVQPYQIANFDFSKTQEVEIRARNIVGDVSNVIHTFVYPSAHREGVTPENDNGSVVVSGKEISDADKAQGFSWTAELSLQQKKV